MGSRQPVPRAAALAEPGDDLRPRCLADEFHKWLAQGSAIFYGTEMVGFRAYRSTSEMQVRNAHLGTRQSKQDHQQQGVVLAPQTEHQKKWAPHRGAIKVVRLDLIVHLVAR